VSGHESRLDRQADLLELFKPGLAARTRHAALFDILRTFTTDERPVETANIVIPGDRYAPVYVTS